MKSLHVSLWLSIFLPVWLQAAPLSLSGVVSSDNQKNITSRYMGFVKEVYVEEGSYVKKGDLLYVIDSKEIDTAATQTDLAIAQAELSLTMYENQYANAMLNLERHQRLLAKDMVSKFEVENLELSTKNLHAMVLIAQKQIEQAKQKRQEVQNQYQYLKVKAPNDGVIISKHIKVGEMALPGVPSLILSDLSTLKIVTEVAESHLGSLKMGDKVSISIASIGYKAYGRVASIIPNANALSHTFKVKIAFDANEKIYPGMYAELLFEGLVP